MDGDDRGEHQAWQGICCIPANRQQREMHVANEDNGVAVLTAESSRFTVLEPMVDEINNRGVSFVCVNWAKTSASPSCNAGLGGMCRWIVTPYVLPSLVQ